MITLSQVEKYCVRIKSNGHTGSGVLIPGKNTFYVFTAAHCLGDKVPDIKDITIEKQNDYASSFIGITSVRIVEFNKDDDFALIEIDFKEEQKILNQYKLGLGVLSEDNIKFWGYQGINVDQYRPFNGKILSVSEDLGRFKITLQEITFDQGGEEGQYVAKGLSGSGVFIFRYNSPFLIGILKSVITNKAWNDDIECCSIKHLDKYISEYVDFSDFDNLKKWRENIEKERDKWEIDQFKNENSEFFEKLYRKNKVLYSDEETLNYITVEQIRKYLAMRDNIHQLSIEFPVLFGTFKEVVSKFVNSVKYEYSRDVTKSNEAIDLKKDLQKELNHALEILPNLTNYDLSDFQIIEWLGMCTLNFTKND